MSSSSSPFRALSLTKRATFLVCIALLLLWACGGGGGTSGGNPRPVPVIASFTATPDSVAPGGSATLAWTVTGATSLSIDQNVGSVTGLNSKVVNPTTTTQYTLTATNTAGHATRTATVTVTQGAVAIPVISPNGGIFNAPQQVTLTTGTSGAGIHYTLDGSAPSASSPLYASPITVSTSLTVKAIAVLNGYTDSPVASADFTIQTQGQAPNLIVITSPRDLPQANTGVAYTYHFAARGGTPPYQWTFVPSISTNVLTRGSSWSLATDGTLTCTPAQITGPDGQTPTSQYVDGFRVLVTDSAGNAGQGSFQVAIVDPASAPTIGTQSPLLPGVVRQAYRLILRAGAGTAPFTWTGSALPDGLALSADGVLSGIPTTEGTSTFSVVATDASSRQGTGTLQLRVDPATSIDFTLASGTVLRSATPRIGTNTGTGNYWDDGGYINEFVQNPGLELPHPRKMYRAWTGTANTIEEWDQVQYQELAELNTGYWDGGKYWILSGPAKGRTGTIQSYVRVADASSPNGWRGVWTLADSDATRVVQTLSTFGKQDIFMVEPQGKADTSSYDPDSSTHVVFGDLPPAWNAYYPWGATAADLTVAVDTTVKHGGASSARVDSNTTQEIGLWSLVLWDNPLRRLRTDTTYHYSAWVRQTSTAGPRTVKLKLAHAFGGADIASTTGSIPADGQFHKLEGDYAGAGESTLGIYITAAGAGSLWVDDVVMSEKQSTTAAAHATGNGTVSATAFAPLPYIVKDLRDLKVGTLRFWYFSMPMGGVGQRLDEALRASTADDASGGDHNLFADLVLAEAVGANPWITTAKEWLPEEHAQLVEYLNSTDTTQGMAKLRADQGHPAPWTSSFNQIYIEYSNEAWNWPSYAYPFDLWHPELYSSFAKERLAAMKASSFYDPAAFTLVANGQIGDDFWVNDAVEAQTYPAADALDTAPYLDTILELPWIESAGGMVGWYGDVTSWQRGTIKLWRDRSHNTKLLCYEGGPGAANWNPPMDEEARQTSTYFASVFIDSVAQMFRDGVDAYNQFTYQNRASWKATTGHSSRLHYPVGYALGLFNEAAGGLDQIQVDAGTYMPTVVPITRDGTNPATLVNGTPAPAVTCRAYQGSSSLGILLVNLNVETNYPVLIHTGHADQTFTVRTLADPDPMRGELEGIGLLTWGDDSTKVNVDQLYESVQPLSSSVVSDGNGNLSLMVPAGGLVTALAGP